MAKPKLLVENFFSVHQFSGHTISANEEESDHEAFRVADERRGPLSYWTPTTNNSSAWVKANCGEARSADTLVIDRGSNLEGETVTLERSSDDSTWTQVFQSTVPTSSSSGADASGSNGALTEEGAWIKTFTSASNQYWRLTVSAMGAGLKPQIRGLWLGDSYDPNLHIERPFTWGRRSLQYDETRSDAGWGGSVNASEARTATINLKMKSESEYDTARGHLEDLYAQGFVMWLLLDPTNHAERSWLSKMPSGELGFEIPTDWGFQVVEVPCREHQPERP